MKFVIACGIVPPDIGGPATIIGDLVHQLDAAGHDVVVVTYTESPISIQGAHIVSVGRKGNVLMRYMRFIRALKSVMSDGAVLIATDCFSTGIPARISLIGKRNLFFLRLGGEWRWEHAIESGRYTGTLVDFWNKKLQVRDLFELALYRWLLHRAKRVLVNSEWFLNLLSSHIPAAYALYRAPLAGANAVRESFRVSGNPIRFLYVGRFAQVKNVPFFARVLKSLHEEDIPFAATFVGSGETKAECEKILQQISGVVFTGKLSHQEIKEQMAQHDVFVLPSFSDVYPNVVLEAMSFGLPCLITSQHGLSMKLSGVIECDPTKEEAWRIAIRQLQDPRYYEQLARNVAYTPSVEYADLTQTILKICASSK